MNDPSDRRWEKVSAALRAAGVAERPPGEDLSAPAGFATRVAARHRSDCRADGTGLLLWRRWSLVGAACATLLLGAGLLVKPTSPPARQFIPVPTLETVELPEAPAR